MARGKYARRRAARLNGNTHTDAAQGIDVAEYQRTLTANTVGKLREIAKRENVKLARAMRKSDIIDALVKAAS